MKTGIAHNTPAIELFLNQCEAVVSYREVSEHLIEFTYNPEIEVSYVPYGVQFDD